jgi:hypothetical protein
MLIHIYIQNLKLVNNIIYITSSSLSSSISSSTQIVANSFRTTTTDGKHAQNRRKLFKFLINKEFFSFFFYKVKNSCIPKFILFIKRCEKYHAVKFSKKKESEIDKVDFLC